MNSEVINAEGSRTASTCPTYSVNTWPPNFFTVAVLSFGPQILILIVRSSCGLRNCKIFEAPSKHSIFCGTSEVLRINQESNLRFDAEKF